MSILHATALRWWIRSANPNLEFQCKHFAFFFFTSTISIQLCGARVPFILTHRGTRISSAPKRNKCECDQFYRLLQMESGEKSAPNSRPLSYLFSHLNHIASNSNGCLSLCKESLCWYARRAKPSTRRILNKSFSPLRLPHYGRIAGRVCTLSRVCTSMGLRVIKINKPISAEMVTD